VRSTNRPAQDLAERGYAVLPGLLESELVAPVAAAAQRIWQESDPGSRGFLQAFDLFTLDEAFMILLDLPPVTDVVRAVLGDNVSVYHSHLTVGGHNTDDVGAFSYRWHQDAKAIVADLGRSGWSPCVSVKAGFFLTDVSRADHGATVFLPGTHRHGGADKRPVPEALLGPRGTCVLFDNRIWHSRGPNVSTEIRSCAYVAYGYRWLQNRDSWQGAGCAIASAELTPRQRFLLGRADSPRDRHTAATSAETGAPRAAE
jgi:hypothetical protein